VPEVKVGCEPCIGHIPIMEDRWSKRGHYHQYHSMMERY
jgi:hypothetical protein